MVLAKDLDTDVQDVQEIVAYLKQDGEEQVSAASFVEADIVRDIKDHVSRKEKLKLRVTNLPNVGKYDEA